MDLSNIGRFLLIVGIGIAVLGGVLILLSRVPFLKDLGNLPGDIRIEGEGFSCYVPLVSMLLISLLLTVGINLLLRLLNR